MSGMSASRRSQSSGLGFLVPWLALVVFMAVLGFCYVHLKHRLAADGNLCRELEIAVRDLAEKLDGVNSDVRKLTGRPSLERRRQEGFIRMMDVSDARIVRLRSQSEAAALPAGTTEVVP